jgi:transposase
MPRRRQPTHSPYDKIPPSFRVCDECGSGVMEYDGRQFTCRAGHSQSAMAVLVAYKKKADPD